MDNEKVLTQLALLREPFHESKISKLPKPTKKQTEDVRRDYKLGIRCKLCGGWHHKDVVHLDYVGHAALTDRLLTVDPFWNWDFAYSNENGTPIIDQNGGFWIKLTVCGVTRLGYGDAQGKSGGDAMKECIGDALRNAAMRFGCALDLWHKGSLHDDQESNNEPTQQRRQTSQRNSQVKLTDNDINWIKAYKANNDVFKDYPDMPEEYKAFIIQQSKSN